MRHTLLIAAMAAVALASASPAPGQDQKKAPAVARTPWGDPDLQGVWTSDSNSTVPFERPETFAGKAVLEGDELARVQQEREQSRARTAPVAGGITAPARCIGTNISAPGPPGPRWSWRPPTAGFRR